ncbi:MAG: efflux RND transporter permease subunit [Brevinema sp.]
MSLIELSVKKPISVSMGLIILIFVGILASFRLPVDIMPQIESPVLSISASYAGAGPEQVESAVTKVLEDAFAILDNVECITATSREGSSSIRIQYYWGTDLDQAIFQVREKIDIVRSYLPTEVKSVRISKFSNDDTPVLGFMIVGIDDQATAYDFAENNIKKNLESISGVGQVDISGGVQTEVHIELNQNRLQAYNLNAEDIARAVSDNNITVAGGYIFQGSYRLGVRTDGEIRNLEGFKNIVITSRSGVPIFLKDVADIYFGGNEDNGITYVTAPDILDESDQEVGRASVIFEIVKTSEANTIEVEKEVQKYLKQLSSALPPNVHIVEMYNNATDIRRAVQGLIDAGLQGGLFALLVIFFYLWEWRSLLVIAVSIPSSVIISFIAMYFTGTSFNTISLAGLTLAIGMMVDSSIVVLENIFRYRKEGYGKYTASIMGAKEVSLAIMTSTFTTIAVFAPILFLEGMMAQLFRDLVITVIAGLLVSLVVSITIIPMLSSLLKETKTSQDSWNQRVLSQGDYLYQNTLSWALRRKKAIVLGSLFFVIAGSAFFIHIMDKESYPAGDDSTVIINFSFPVGTRYEENRKISREILKEIKQYLGDKAELINLQVKLNWQRASAVLEYRSRMRIKLIPANQRPESVGQIVEGMYPILQRYPVKNFVNMGGGYRSSRGESIKMEIQGNNLDQSQRVADKLIDLLSGMSGIRNPRNTSEDQVMEVTLIPDRVALVREGLTPRELFRIIQTSFGGKNASQIMGVMGNDIDIRVRIREQDRMSLEALKNFNIVLNQKKIVPLNALVDIIQQKGPRDIRRSDSVRSLEIRTSLSGKYVKDVVGAVHDIQAKIAEVIFIPPGTRIVFKGDYQDTQKGFTSIFIAFLLAIFIVYALMAAMFESYIEPFVIMISVPFGVFGSLVVLYLADQSLNVYSTIGMVILVGIVINNGIVLIDYINKLLDRGYGLIDAVSAAGVRRLRPICMTTFTTILGMVPMALGLGDQKETYAPVAISVIGGLLISTLFTLFIVPLFYTAIRTYIPRKKKV